MQRHTGVLAALGLILLLAAPALAGTPPGEGDSLPPLSILAPTLEQDREYLGLADAETFSPGDLACDLLILEVVGVYCPFCHKQAPLFNDLHKRLRRAKLDGRIKIMAVASGATPEEIEYLREHSQYRFPVLRDQDYSLHSQLGEPKTPFTLVVDAQGRVLYVKTGVIEDIDAFFTWLKQHLE